MHSKEMRGRSTNRNEHFFKLKSNDFLKNKTENILEQNNFFRVFKLNSNQFLKNKTDNVTVEIFEQNNF